MPYKNIEDRRSCWRKWRDNNRSIHNERQRIQKQAVYANREAKECSVDGCSLVGERHHEDYSEPKEIIWLCKYHHEQLHHKDARLCKIEKCQLKHHAHGYCNKHMKRWQRGTL